ncbi:MAG: sugar ABC transporter permease, partial [Deltaproteobacteria bacterium]|nr:sugar ABC transporter permease [Deltaproteobacteria bacterium]
MPAERFFPKNKVATAILILATIYFAVVLWFPILQTFTWSFADKFLFTMKWVGLENYRKMFTDDPDFIQAIQVTFSYTLMSVPPVVILSLLLAVVVNSIKNVAARGMFTASYFIAYIVPLVAIAIVWRYMFEPSRVGLFNAILGQLGFKPIRWLADTSTALASLAMVGVWKDIGYMLVIYLAGLQAIPVVFYEAAQIDGASRWSVFRHITLPLLSPTILFVVIMETLHALMMFTETYVMTGQSGMVAGGPLGSTRTL